MRKLKNNAIMKLAIICVVLPSQQVSNVFLGTGVSYGIYRTKINFRIPHGVSVVASMSSRDDRPVTPVV